MDNPSGEEGADGVDVGLLQFGEGDVDALGYAFC